MRYWWNNTDMKITQYLKTNLLSVQLWNPSPNGLKSNMGFHRIRPVNKKLNHGMA